MYNTSSACAIQTLEKIPLSTVTLLRNSGAIMTRAGNVAANVVAGLTLGACAYLPQLNTERRVEVRDIKAVVECEIVAAVRALGPAIFKIGKWDAKSSLDLTLVEHVDIDGKIAWIIPIANILTPQRKPCKQENQHSSRGVHYDHT
jgi:hypothetical protein